MLQVTNGEKGFLAYETRFWFPSEQSMSYSPFYYSYEVRMAKATSDQHLGALCGARWQQRPTQCGCAATAFCPSEGI